MKRFIAAMIAGLCLANTFTPIGGMSACNALAETQSSQIYWVNPDGGTKYHWVHYCASIHPRYYNGMIEITEEQLRMEPYNALLPCSVCMGATEELEEATQNNDVADQSIANPDSLEQIVIQHAKDHLTEIYGWQDSRTNDFIFQYHESEGVLEFWPDEDHSAYCYRMYFDRVNGNTIEVVTPFYQGNYENYPGEGNIREVADAFVEKDWLHQWNADSIKMFSEMVYRWGEIVPTERLSDGLKSGNITADEAIREFWISCLGPEEGWTHAAKTWLGELLGETFDDTSRNVSSITILRTHDEQIKKDLDYNIECTLSYYVESIPSEMNIDQYLGQGWKLVEGATAQFSRPNEDNFGDGYDQGLFVLENNEERVAITINHSNEQWESHAIGPCVLTDRDLTITIQVTGMNPRFQIAYAEKSGENITCVYDIDTNGMLHLYKYDVIRSSTGDSFSLYESSDERWTWIETSAGKKTNGTEIKYISSADAAMRLGDLPRSSAEFAEWNKKPYLDGYAMVNGVHLRERTSSHSRDLGMLNQGTIVKVTGKYDGDPFPWYGVQLGELKGYVASNYVCMDDNDNPTASSYFLLPAAAATQETDLKSGTGLFDRVIMKVSVGTCMHVLFEKDGWYYVCIPSQDMGCIMDVNGSYGYIRNSAVHTGLTTYDLMLDMQ